jgi:serine/threonine protein phosphatase 1
VIDRLIALGAEGDFDVKALKGNHEEALLTFLEDATFGPAWCEHGGAQTLSSYGVQPPIPRAGEADWETVRLALVEALPAAHRRFFEDLELFAVHGDYVFVHAGLRPGVPLDRQTPRDLMWIRQPFLDSAGPFDKIVVHGHTAANAAFFGSQRIGIDTGAYATGVLTAVRLEAGSCRFIQARRAAVRSALTI